MSGSRTAMARVGFALLALLIVVAICAPMLAPYDPRASVGPALAAPSFDHLLGTNDLGQDVLSRVIWGARPTLAIAVSATAIAVALGIAVGITAGLVGGITDAAAMRVVDVMLALPRLPLLVVIAAFSGAVGAGVGVLIGLLAWAPVARVLRAQTLSLRTRGYIVAASGFGAGTTHLLRRHVLPALSPLVVAQIIIVAGNAVMLEASLAFLGLADPTGVSWGIDLHRSLTEPGILLIDAWRWWVLPPGVAVSLAILSFTFIGVGLEPKLNRRWSRWA